jgi:hypothetical protein
MNEENLRKTAGDLYFERGAAYYRDGRVRSLAVDALGATAVVDGSRPYRVRLAIRRRTLVGECSCPMGDESVFCKHCVATGLAWIDAGAPTTDGTDDTDTDQDDDDTESVEAAEELTVALRAFLVEQDPAWLADMLVDAADESPVLRALLLVAAGADPADALDPTEYEEEIGDAFEIDEFADWGLTAYLRGVNIVLGKVAGLIDAGFPEAAVELSEYALDMLEDSMERVADSGGGMRRAMRRAAEIHHLACDESDPEPVELARQQAAERSAGG